MTLILKPKPCTPGTESNCEEVKGESSEMRYLCSNSENLSIDRTSELVVGQGLSFRSLSFRFARPSESSKEAL